MNFYAIVKNKEFYVGSTSLSLSEIGDKALRVNQEISWKFNSYDYAIPILVLLGTSPFPNAYETKSAWIRTLEKYGLKTVNGAFDKKSGTIPESSWIKENVKPPIHPDFYSENIHTYLKSRNLISKEPDSKEISNLETRIKDLEKIIEELKNKKDDRVKWSIDNKKINITLSFE